MCHYSLAVWREESGSEAEQRKSQEVAAVRSQTKDHEKEILLHLVGEYAAVGLFLPILVVSVLCVLWSFVVDVVF